MITEAAERFETWGATPSVMLTKQFVKKDHEIEYFANFCAALAIFSAPKPAPSPPPPTNAPPP